MTTSTPRWHYPALLGVLVLALGLHFVALEQVGYGNLYYAAAVKSMSLNWHNFFYVSFDPGGFVAVDKPPLGLWVQTWSVLLLGFNGWSLMFPQALAGVLSVGLLYGLVRRTFGPTAALLAALFLALTPISIAANRNNTMDSQLVFTSLLATWAVVYATEKGSGWWLALCAALVGLGFNIKMLQAVMVLPAFYLLYFIAARTHWWKRLVHLALATGVLAVVSLAWPLAVDLTPADQRPYVGSSQNNTVMELIIGHNGLSRLGQLAGITRQNNAPPRNNANLPPNPNRPSNGLNNGVQPPPPNDGYLPPNGGYGPYAGPGAQPGAGPMSQETGEAGLFRLFNAQLAGQASWLIPLALLSLGVLLWHTRWQWPLSPQHQAVVLWGAWLIPQMVFFSYAGLFHRYYLEMMAPAIAALSGAGLAALWDSYTQPTSARGWLLPVAIGLGTLTAAYIIWITSEEWRWWLVPVVIGGGVSVVGLALARNGSRPLASGLVVVGLAALLLGPALWSATPVLGSDVALPYAGPELLRGGRNFRQLSTNNSKLVTYLTTHRNGEIYLAATLNANTAAPIILSTGEPVMAMGGFSGGDNILTVTDLQTKIQNGEVRYFLVSNGNGGPNTPPNDGNDGPPPNNPNAPRPNAPRLNAPGLNNGLNQPPPNNPNAPRPNAPGLNNGLNQPPPPNGGNDGPPNGGGNGGGPARSNALTQWVSANCTPVASTEWQEANQPQQGNGPGSGPVQLYDCGAQR